MTIWDDREPEGLKEKYGVSKVGKEYRRCCVRDGALLMWAKFLLKVCDEEGIIELQKTVSFVRRIRQYWSRLK